MIFYFVSEWGIRNKLPEKITFPLYACPICMTPAYGSVIYWIFVGNSVKEWILVVLAAMGINALFVWFWAAIKQK